MSLLCKKNVCVGKHKTTVRRYCMKIHCLPPTKRDDDERVPETSLEATRPKVVDRVRLVEVAAGRLASGGLLGTSVFGNFTGRTVSEQFNDGQVFIAIFVTFVVLATINPDSWRKGVGATEASIELRSTRLGMIAMCLIFAMEFLHT